MLDHLEDMPILNMIFGRSGTAAPSPKPLVKRRASPLKESPARDEEDETSDCPMEQVADELQIKTFHPRRKQDESSLPIDKIYPLSVTSSIHMATA